MLKGSTVRVSLSTIAAEAGVSIATVSRIANGKLDRANRDTVARVQALLSRHGYRPNPIGRSLRRQESRIVAMLAPNLDNPAMGAIATSTETALRAAGYVMILCDTHDQPALQDEYLAEMRAQMVRGYVLVSPAASSGLKALMERGEPAVLVNRRAGYAEHAAPFVGIDNRAAGAMAAEMLLESGITRPAILHSSLASSAIADRVRGATERLKASGLPDADIRIASSERLRHLEAGYEAARRLTGSAGWPEGLVCVSDQMAYGAYRLARETGVEVPGECRMVGIDENPLNAWIAPWLSSVHVPYDAFGGAIVEQLTELWGGGRPGDRLLPHRRVPRA